MDSQTFLRRRVFREAGSINVVPSVSIILNTLTAIDMYLASQANRYPAFPESKIFVETDVKVFFLDAVTWRSITSQCAICIASWTEWS